MKYPLEPKSKCKRKKLKLELEISETLTEIEGRGKVDVGKSMPNYYKSKFAFSILISLFIDLELS